MKIQITTAVIAGVLSLIPGSALRAANSRDLMIQGASETAPVHLHFAGAERLELGAPGELCVIRHGSRPQHYRPDAYQIVNGKEHHLTRLATRLTVPTGLP